MIITALRALIKAISVSFLPKWGWALIIILFQFFGPISFFICGRDTGNEKDV